MEEETNKEGSGEEIIEEPRYITRLMRIHCDKGTIQNYINVGEDHGVLAGGGSGQQPVLNANDHTSDNIIHLGNCLSEENPERKMREHLTRLVLGSLGGPLVMLASKKITDFLEEKGIMAYKCKPCTPMPWLNANEDCILDGAPALTMESELACRYGGTIKFVAMKDYPPSAQGEEGQNGETQEEEAPSARDVVGEAVAAAVESAIADVADTGKVGLEAAERAQIALAEAAAMPPQDVPLAAGVGAVLGAGADMGMDMPLTAGVGAVLGASADMAMDMLPEFGGDMADENGMAINQAAMAGFRIYGDTVANAGSGAVALYNTVRTLSPELDMTFAQAVEMMEPYKAIDSPLGPMPVGVAHALDQMGYDTNYCFGTDMDLISKEAAKADAGIILYATTKNCRYVSFHADPAGQTFTFYNETGKAGDSRTLQSFDNALSAGGRTKLGAVTILANKPGRMKKEECSLQERNLYGGKGISGRVYPKGAPGAGTDGGEAPF